VANGSGASLHGGSAGSISRRGSERWFRSRGGKIAAAIHGSIAAKQRVMAASSCGIGASAGETGGGGVNLGKGVASATSRLASGDNAARRQRRRMTAFYHVAA
jgi:hypothetical protein